MGKRKTVDISEENPKTLSVESKKRIASCIERYPSLWSLSHPLYKIKDARDAGWRKVAAEVNFSESLCRKTWKTLCDSLRYQLKKIKGKSGDGLSENEATDDESAGVDNEIERWEMWDAMRFYQEGKPQRKTVSSFATNGTTSEEQVNPASETTQDNTCHSIVHEEESSTDTTGSAGKSLISSSSEPSSSKSKKSLTETPKIYDYASKLTKMKVQPSETETDKLLSTINEFINVKKSTLQQRQSSSTPTSTLKYLSIYSNLDRILSKLPEAVVEDLNIEFITLAHAELKKIETVEVYEVQA